MKAANPCVSDLRSSVDLSQPFPLSRNVVDSALVTVGADSDVELIPGLSHPDP